MTTLRQSILDLARQLGFSSAGIVPAVSSPELDHYLAWLNAGMHGTMSYLARSDRVARRKDLQLILPGALSLIVVTLDYHTTSLPPEITTDPLRGRISNYTWGLDYHDTIMDRLRKLTALVDALEQGASSKAYVDTGAILERNYAAQAQLGFVGKNTMLINPRRGSYFFIGEIITTLELEYDLPSNSMPGCGSCARCLAACPTHAFPTPYVLDARRCISYLTIEHKGFIPSELRSLMANWVYGCDVCQQVCPWQRFVVPSSKSDFPPTNIDHCVPRLIDLLRLTEASFAEEFDRSAIKRIKRERLVRNACIAAGNSGNAEFVPQLSLLLADDKPLVRGHAAWALGQLDAGITALSKVLKNETDATVQQEMRNALARL